MTWDFTSEESERNSRSNLQTSTSEGAQEAGPWRCRPKPSRGPSKPTDMHWPGFGGSDSVLGGTCRLLHLRALSVVNGLALFFGLRDLGARRKSSAEKKPSDDLAVSFSVGFLGSGESRSAGTGRPSFRGLLLGWPSSSSRLQRSPQQVCSESGL